MDQNAKNAKKAEFHSLLYGCVQRPQTHLTRTNSQKLIEMYHEALEGPEVISGHESAGLDIVTKERVEQVFKHGRTVETDIEQNANGELVSGAISVLMFDHPSTDFRPKKWSDDFYRNLEGKDRIEMLGIAGALIVAEIDRLDALKTLPKKEGKKKNEK